MKSHKEILASLKKQFEKHNIPIIDFENQVFPTITDIRWASEPQFHLELLKIERARLPVGKIKNQETNNTPIKLAFDDKDRIVYEERAKWDSSGPYKKFIFYKDDSTWEYKYADKKIESIAYQTLVNGRPEIFASYEKEVTNTVDKYEYNNDRLVKIDSYSSYAPYDPQKPDYIITYNTLGDIEEITRIDEPSNFFPKGQNLVIFKNHGYSIKALTDLLIYETTSSIKAELKKEKLSERKYLLIFVSKAFNSDVWFPPRIIISKSNDINNFDLRMDEMFDFDSISFKINYKSSQKLKEVSSLLMQEIELKEKFNLPLKIIIKIAKEMKSWHSEKGNEFRSADNLIILPLDFPDDYQEDVNTILQRIYSKGETKKLRNIN